MDSPVAMISYSSADQEAAELLHDELALRCFRVIHDGHTFTDGSRIQTDMAEGVESCDVFVAYLTPNSLYLDRHPDQPRPALVGELLPALRRRRTSLGDGKGGKPIIILLLHGLGDRQAASETIRQLTGERVDSIWSTWLDQDTDHITQAEAADVAESALRALLERDGQVQPIELFVATRGTGPPSRRFTIDGARLFGGDRRPGDPSNWARLAAAVQSVRRHMEAVAGGGPLRIELACHLSAALATGRTFHQATRWKPTFVTRHGEATPATHSNGGDLKGDFERHAESGDLIVDVDLLGHNVSALTDETAGRLPPAGGRISLRRAGSGDLSAEEISQLARTTADRIRKGHATLRPNRIHLAMSAPAAYAGLLGHHLTALEADIVTYELAGGAYTVAMTVRGATP